MLTIPFLDTQPVYVVIKLVIALCSQTPFKYSIAGPPKRVRAIHAGKLGSHHFETAHSLSVTSESGNLS